VYFISTYNKHLTLLLWQYFCILNPKTTQKNPEVKYFTNIYNLYQTVLEQTIQRQRYTITDPLLVILSWQPMSLTKKQQAKKKKKGIMFVVN